MDRICIRQTWIRWLPWEHPQCPRKEGERRNGMCSVKQKNRRRRSGRVTNGGDREGGMRERGVKEASIRKI